MPDHLRRDIQLSQQAIDKYIMKALMDALTPPPEPPLHDPVALEVWLNA